MNDAEAFCLHQCFARLREKAHSACDRQHSTTLCPSVCPDVATIDVFQNQEVHPGLMAELMHLNDVGALESPNGLSLTTEALDYGGDIEQPRP